MRCRYELILFDLDGTLTDSSPGIFNALAKGFRSAGWPEPGPEQRRRFIGPPLYDILAELYPDMPEETAKALVSADRSYYIARGFAENRVFDGIPALLSDLRGAGAKLAVATSKPIRATNLVLKKLHLAERFDLVSAADNSDHGGGKEELILPVLRKTGVPPSRALMIGDTKYDAAGARNAGTDFVGVLYGFGTRGEMEREGAAHFAETVEELRRFLFSI